MKKESSNGHRLYLTIGLILATIGLIYIGAYVLYLKAYSARTFTLTYSLIYFQLARPVFFIFSFAVLTRLLLASPVVTLPQSYSRYARYILALLISLYAVLMIILYFPVFLSVPFEIVYYLLLQSPLLFILIGIFLSLSISIKRDEN
ncbi:hypothetical protein [Marinilactibacillus kalidii]|uniref:hypothetical protein n=1 Tax=Marinilactibacillus kalidii TaxID=2820274 RepID=UPI001ABED8A2|nr:hypothetical protein [Marinilactibacillus kalidii]